MRFAGRPQGVSGIGSISWRGGYRGIIRGRSGGVSERAAGACVLGVVGFLAARWPPPNWSGHGVHQGLSFLP